MRDDPELTHAAIHALNEWLYEEWSFNYEDRIFTTPVITLPIVEKAIEELEWVLERGAKTVLIRPAPVPGYGGSRSFAFEEFDPFWQRVVDADILVSMHASDSGYSRYQGDWTGPTEMLPFRLDSVPHADVGKRASRGRIGGHDLPRTAVPVPDASDRLHRERRRLGRCRSSSTSRICTPRCRRRSRRTRSTPSSGTCTSARSTRTTSRAGWGPRHGPPPVRLGLPASGGAGRAVQLPRPPAEELRGGRRGEDHGWQPRPHHAGRCHRLTSQSRATPRPICSSIRLGGSWTSGVLIGQSQRIDEEPGQLVHGLVHAAVHGALDQPHLGEPAGHRTERGRGDLGIQVGVGEPVFLQAADRVSNLC